MKLSGAEAMRYLARPDPGHAGLLIYGADGMRVADKRIAAVAALVGPEGEAEMRLVRIAAGDLRKEPSLLADSMGEVGFFPGVRVVLVEGASDGLGKLMGEALAGWREGDAVLVATAGALTPKSALRVAFEKAKNAVAIGIYDDPPSRAEIAAMVERSGLGRIDEAAMGELASLAQELEPGDFRQTLDKLALFKLGDDAPLSPGEIHALAPNAGDTDELDLAAAVAEGEARRIGPLIRRLQAQGKQPVGIVIQVQRYFRALHAISADPGGPAAGARRVFGFGNRRERMAAQAGRWPQAKLEGALQGLVECDLSLRSTSRAPTMALVERTLMRIAMQYGERR